MHGILAIILSEKREDELMVTARWAPISAIYLITCLVDLDISAQKLVLLQHLLQQTLITRNGKSNK